MVDCQKRSAERDMLFIGIRRTRFHVRRVPRAGKLGGSPVSEI